MTSGGLLLLRIKNSGSSLGKMTTYPTPIPFGSTDNWLAAGQIISAVDSKVGGGGNFSPSASLVIFFNFNPRPKRKNKVKDSPLIYTLTILINLIKIHFRQ